LKTPTLLAHAIRDLIRPCSPRNGADHHGARETATVRFAGAVLLPAQTTSTSKIVCFSEARGSDRTVELRPGRKPPETLVAAEAART
jgi:hypothetical protein